MELFKNKNESFFGTQCSVQHVLSLIRLYLVHGDFALDFEQ